MTTEQPEDPGLTVTFDSEAVSLILEGLALLPYGRVKSLYEALQVAAEDFWGVEEEHEQIG